MDWAGKRNPIGLRFIYLFCDNKIKYSVRSFLSLCDNFGEIIILSCAPVKALI